MTVKWARSGACDDSGMTIVEVMMAAVIFFIVLTGVLGMIGVSTNMGIQAKQQAVVTNVLNSYIERVQSMPFEKVVIGTAADELASSETTTVGAYTLTIVPTITDDTASATKLLSVTITLTAPNGANETRQTSVVLRDKTRFLTQGLRSPETDPQIEWYTPVMPDEGVVVWGSSWEYGQLRIAADVTAFEGRTIDSVVIETDAGWSLRSVDGTTVAQWSPGTDTYSVPSTFVWDTLQWELVDADTDTYEQVIRDGVRTITLKAVDSEGAEGRAIYVLLVDNRAPQQPGAPTASITALNQGTLSWSAAMDGTTAAFGYKVIAYTQSLSGDWVSSDPATVTALSTSGSTQPFTRYWAQLSAVSPRGLESTSTDMVSPWISPPQAAGVVTVTPVNGGKYDTSVSLSVSGPQFPADGITYKWARATSPSGPWTYFAYSAEASDDHYGEKPAVVYYYRCFVSFTPGYDYYGTASAPYVDFPSTVVGPTGTSSGALQELWP